MRLKLLFFMAALTMTLPCLSQVVPPAARRQPVDLSIGGGFDYWSGDWGGAIHRFGPSVWASADIWHGLGVNMEVHSMIAGGSAPSPRFKYVVGEGGLMYTYHHWKKINPYAKAELGFGSLTVPYPATIQSHYTNTTWALGGGAEYHAWRRVWTRVDYTYDGFPHFYSTVTGLYHTLNPNGITVGATYHFR